jgi:diguanylate cyclase (GGDEF)-like protein
VQRSSAAVSCPPEAHPDEGDVFECGIEPLASLFGMPLFTDLAHARFSEARRHSFIASLICVEMDDFDSIRKRYGRLVADAAMLSVADLLRVSLRREDMVALSGDATFMVLLLHCDGVSAHAKAESLRLAMTSMDPTGTGLTVSIGVAAGVPGPGLRFDLLRTRATDALASARARGGDCVVVAATPSSARFERAAPTH